MPIKILSVADMHLGRTSSLPGNNPRPSVREGLSNLVRYATENGVDVLCFSGDIVDNYNNFWEARGPLQSAFDDFKHAGIEVFMVAGNHDFNVLASMVQEDRNQHVHLLGKNARWEVQTFTKGQERIQFVGWSFNQKHISRDPLADFDDQMLKPDIPSVGLLHCETDSPESKYAPVSTDHLIKTGLNAWLLGHIHKPNVIREREPFIAYPGSAQALSAGEEGIHGALLLSIEQDGSLENRKIPLSPVRYETITVEIKPHTNQDAFRMAVADVIDEKSPKFLDESDQPEYLIYDLELTGEHENPLQAEAWAQELADAPPLRPAGYPQSNYMIRKLRNHIVQALINLEKLAQEPSPAGELAKSIIALQNGKSTEFLDKLRLDWKEKQRQLQNAGAFHPVFRNEDLDMSGENERAGEYLMKTCKALLENITNQMQNA
jgi:DNA repair exonuclease SbcCD nuclease subunit